VHSCLFLVVEGARKIDDLEHYNLALVNGCQSTLSTCSSIVHRGYFATVRDVAYHVRGQLVYCARAQKAHACEDLAMENLYDLDRALRSISLAG
jgi:hypothetical protein